MKRITRPPIYNKVITQNDRVYASYTKIGDKWHRALFTRKSVERGEILAYYDGVELSKEEAKRSRSQYLMTARDTNDRRKHVTLDGDPIHLIDGLPNLAAFANYVTRTHANAIFEDRAHLQNKPSPFRTFIVLKASRDIPAGKEVRVDYDLGVVDRPFRKQMLANGISKRDLDSKDYEQITWTYP